MINDNDTYFEKDHYVFSFIYEDFYNFIENKIKIDQNLILEKIIYNITTSLIFKFRISINSIRIKNR